MPPPCVLCLLGTALGSLGRWAKIPTLSPLSDGGKIVPLGHISGIRRFQVLLCSVHGIIPPIRDAFLVFVVLLCHMLLGLSPLGSCTGTFFASSFVTCCSFVPLLGDCTGTFFTSPCFLALIRLRILRAFFSSLGTFSVKRMTNHWRPAGNIYW